MTRGLGSSNYLHLEPWLIIFGGLKAQCDLGGLANGGTGFFTGTALYVLS